MLPPLPNFHHLDGFLGAQFVFDLKSIFGRAVVLLLFLPSPSLPPSAMMTEQRQTVFLPASSKDVSLSFPSHVQLVSPALMLRGTCGSHNETPVRLFCRTLHSALQSVQATNSAASPHTEEAWSLFDPFLNCLVFVTLNWTRRGHCVLMHRKEPLQSEYRISPFFPIA